MITDALLTFAQDKTIANPETSTAVILGNGKVAETTEVDRTLNIVCTCAANGNPSPTNATLAATLEGSYDNGSHWETIMTFGEVTVADAVAGKRLINFAKLPLKTPSCLRIKIAQKNGPVYGVVYTAYLTPSAESN